MNRSLLAALGVLMVGLCGCGDEGPTLVPVQGRVVLDGKPLAGKSIRFFPEPQVPGQGAGANTDQDGRYVLLAVRPGATRDMRGVPPGSYRVIVTEPMFPIDLPVQSADDKDPAPAVGLPAPPTKAKRVIPPIYSTPETTPLRVEVPQEGGELNLELSTSMSR